MDEVSADGPAAPKRGGRRLAKELGTSHQVVARNLVRIRRVQRLSTTRMSEMLRARGHLIHASSITRIEKGDRRVDVDDLTAIAAVLGVTQQRMLDEPGEDECEICHGFPPAGFACKECGADA